MVHYGGSYGGSDAGSLRGSTGGSSQRFSAAVCCAVALLVAAPVMAQDRSGDAAQQQPPIQARPGGPELSPRTDQTLDVSKGTRLVLSNNAGEVVVRSWDRDQVRVVAAHDERVEIDIQTSENTLRLRNRGRRGPAGMVDYQVTVPRWMPVNLSGNYLETTIEGTTAEVTVETVHGNVRVVGGSGTVSARSVEGIITIDKASGNVRATTVNEGIRLTNVSGDMVAETTNGDIWVENAQTTSLEISTVNGDVTFNGTMRDGGAYRVTTHDGDIRMGLGGANATVFVRTFQGDFGADFPIQLPAGQEARSGSKRFNFTIGSGAARIELQTFNGDIYLARQRVTSEDEARRMRRDQRWKVEPPVPQPPQPAPALKPPKPPGEAWALAGIVPGAWMVAPEVAVEVDVAVDLNDSAGFVGEDDIDPDPDWDTDEDPDWDDDDDFDAAPVLAPLAPPPPAAPLPVAPRPPSSR